MPVAANRHRFELLRSPRSFAAICFGLLAVLAASGAIAKQAADTIITHGKILTVDPGFHTVEALAITNGRIVATGTSRPGSKVSTRAATRWGSSPPRPRA